MPSVSTTPLHHSGFVVQVHASIMDVMNDPAAMTELKQRYDFVFFDSPPIMGVSDASILASEVDMTLQVIQYRRYPQPMNIRAKQMIEKVGGNLMGIVLNNINMSQDESYYYYSGYYHDYYSKNEEMDAAPGAEGAEFLPAGGKTGAATSTVRCTPHEPARAGSLGIPRCNEVQPRAPRPGRGRHLRPAHRHRRGRPDHRATRQ